MLYAKFVKIGIMEKKMKMWKVYGNNNDTDNGKIRNEKLSSFRLR